MSEIKKSYIFYVENKSNESQKNVRLLGNEFIGNNDVIVKHINQSPFVDLQKELNFENGGYIKKGYATATFFNKTQAATFKKNEDVLVFSLDCFANNAVYEFKSEMFLDKDNHLYCDIPPNVSFGLELHLMEQKS